MTLAQAVREIDRRALQRWLPQLDAWLLPEQFYGVQHTWPQLYRSDGGGRFFVVTDGDELLSHCAVRTVAVRGAGGVVAVNLLGSVATSPEHRGRGLAGQVLAAALEATATAAAHTLLWAERDGLYGRVGFVPGATESCLLLARRPRHGGGVVRAATIVDHPALGALHDQKPWRVERTAVAMSGLLTTPGLFTFVLERDGQPVAYACTGKGADLQGYWHELGGSDEDLAELLPAALHLADQRDALLLLPPYRPRLRGLLGVAVVGEAMVAGPMVRSCGGAALPPCWIDGLDSV
jgi:GNAT superfamily N-acetyltransferase